MRILRRDYYGLHFLTDWVHERGGAALDLFGKSYNDLIVEWIGIHLHERTGIVLHSRDNIRRRHFTAGPEGNGNLIIAVNMVVQQGLVRLALKRTSVEQP